MGQMGQMVQMVVAPEVDPDLVEGRYPGADALQKCDPQTPEVKAGVTLWTLGPQPPPQCCDCRMVKAACL